jgi:branched-chain amino acid transport system permease protein
MAGGYSLFVTREWPTILSILMAFVVVVVLALLLERLAFRPLRGANPATMLVMTFAISFLLRAIAQKKWSAQGKAVNQLSGLNKAFTLGSLNIRWVTVVAIVVSSSLLIATQAFLTRTNLGLQMRAAASDFGTAQILGVRADRVVVGTFVLSGILATAAMLLFSVQRPVITPDWGLQIGLVALVGVVIGGLDRLGPATLGGFFVGFANSWLANLLPSDKRIFLDSALYGLVILVLLIRPAGLFQRHVIAERV